MACLWQIGASRSRHERTCGVVFFYVDVGIPYMYVGRYSSSVHLVIFEKKFCLTSFIFLVHLLHLLRFCTDFLYIFLSSIESCMVERLENIYLHRTASVLFARMIPGR